VPALLVAHALTSLRYQRVGAGLSLGAGVFALYFFHSPSGQLLVSMPLILFAAGLYMADLPHRRASAYVLIVLFLAIIVSFGVPQIVRVAHRTNDGDLGMRTVDGNGVTLAWAPRGPGFPLTGTDWQTATDRCAHLSADGTHVSSEGVGPWRLPTRDELVRSLTRTNENAGGSLDAVGAAHYRVTPDKETPLWDPHGEVIYYWTNERKSDAAAYLVAYNGAVRARSITSAPAYQGYRCVRGTTTNR
jgi:hypothetical protein